MNLGKVGKFIAEKRKEKGYTQEKMGEMLGVNGKTISKWERGVNAPDISLLFPTVFPKVPVVIQVLLIYLQFL